jgi:hypothetical protein
MRGEFPASVSKSVEGIEDSIIQLLIDLKITIQQMKKAHIENLIKINYLT